MGKIMNKWKKYSDYKNVTLEGQLDLSQGLVDITDPCYDQDTWCRINNVEVKPGKYNCFLTHSDQGEWGHRIAGITIVHELFGVLLLPTCTERLGNIGVDAGLAGFFVSPKPNFNDEDWATLCHKISDKDSDLVPDQWFFSNSGYGDGEYTVNCLRNEAGTIIALDIAFIINETGEED